MVSRNIEEPEGPFIFSKGQEDGDAVDKELGGERTKVLGKGLKGKGAQGNGVKKKIRGNLSTAAEWEQILKAATTPTATPLLARLCMMSSRANRNALSQLVMDLADPPLVPIQSQSPQCLGEVKLVDIVAKIEGTTRFAKVNELVRMLAVMNLVLQLDQ